MMASVFDSYRKMDAMMNPYSIRRTLTAVAALAAAAVLISTSASATENPLPACEHKPQTPPDPSQPPPPPPQFEPTTITAIGQAYYCIFDNYFGGPILDDRSLLLPAFAGLTQELQRRGLDQSKANPPALIGTRSADWAAFSRVYRAINADLPQDPVVRQAVAEATMLAMVNALNDDHAHWDSGRHSDQSRATLGLILSGFRGPAQELFDPAATAPFFITSVAPRSPALSAGVQAGDEIITINGVPPYVNAVLNAGAISWITAPAEGTQVTLTLHRPATNATLTVALTAQNVAPPIIPIGATLVDGNIAYGKLEGFAVEQTEQLLNDISELNRTTHLRGVIFDLRGNGGGDGAASSMLLDALVHDRVTDYWCNNTPTRDHCTANRLDASVPLLNLPVVVLVDRVCASACDAFSGTVKDLHLGTLVGTRTSGVVSGPSDPYSLEDGSLIWLPAFYQIGANRERIDGIGVAPDYYAPLTAADLSAGRDPGLTKALELLR
jgi:carboxyl-terminal processing protease